MSFNLKFSKEDELKFKYLKLIDFKLKPTNIAQLKMNYLE